MKKMHIAALVIIAGAIAVLISFMGNVSSNVTIASAEKEPGKFVHLMVKIDKTKPMQYDPVKDPNYLAFTALDTLGNSIKVVYHNAKPTDMEKSEQVSITGSVQGDHFECTQILVKCPSKYKDDPNAAKQSLNSQVSSN